MKTKQLDSIQTQNSRYLQRAEIKPPTLDTFISKALVSHEKVRVKHIKQVMQGVLADMEQWHYARGSQQLRGLRKAELNDEANPEEIAEALSNAAGEAGLI